MSAAPLRHGPENRDLVMYEPIWKAALDSAKSLSTVSRYAGGSSLPTTGVRIPFWLRSFDELGACVRPH